MVIICMQGNLMKNKINIAIIYGSTRKNRQGIRFVKYIHSQIKKRKQNSFIIDPLKTKFPMLDKRFDDYKKNKAPKPISDVQKILTKCDAFIIVSAEYNHMPPPALINTLNYFYKEYDRKASCVCTYSTGDFAGIRVQSPLRALLTQLGCPPIKYGMYQTRVNKFFDLNGMPSNDSDAKKRFNLFFDELIWYAEAYKNNRPIL